VKKVIIEGRNRILDDFFKVDEAYLRYERFDGTMTPVVRRLSLERGDSVAALLFNPRSNRMILVNQFKYPTYGKGPGWITETMAGMIDGDETPQSAARREILEETGYRVQSLEHISTFYLSPGGSSERIVLYYAEVDGDKASKGGGLATENEDIITVELTVEDALKQIENGEIADAKTIIAVYWLRDRLAGRTGEPGN
jgi:nudix-type nucleoside diphosphatase (YffH/AdpP family)